MTWRGPGWLAMRCAVYYDFLPPLNRGPSGPRSIPAELSCFSWRFPSARRVLDFSCGDDTSVGGSGVKASGLADGIE